MEPFVHGMIGAAIAQSCSDKKEIRMATAIGLVAGIIPDADIVAYLFTDHLSATLLHRHFTHAIIFIPIGGLIGAFLLWPFIRHSMDFLKIYLFSSLGYMHHSFLDACTSYGTYIYWPFSDKRVAWDIISIIDPIFALVLAIFVLIAFWKKRPGLSHIGIAFVIAYLSIGVFVRETVTATVQELAKSRGHIAERIRVTPTLGNIVLWRSIYETDCVFYIDGVLVQINGKSKVYKGTSIKKYQSAIDYPNIIESSVLYNDIKRFAAFSDNFVAIHPLQKYTIIDLRYSFIPNEIQPIWGIEINQSAQDENAPFIHYNNIRKDMLLNYMRMIKN